MIIILAIASSISWVYNKKLIEQTGTIADQKMQIITMDMDKEIATILGICDNLRDNEELQQLMNLEDETFWNDYSTMKKISDILQKSVYAYTSVTSIFATNLDKQICDPLYQIYPYREIIADYKDFDEFIASGKFNAFSAPTNFPNRLDSINDIEKSEITFFSQYMSNYNFKLFGYLLININKEQLFRDVSQTHKKVFDFTYIIDEKNEVINKFGTPLQEDDIIRAFGSRDGKNHEILEINGEEYYLIRQSLSAYPDWKIIGGIAYGKVKKDSTLILNIVYIIGIFSVLAGIFIAYLLAKKITDPIIEINRAMTQFEERKWPRHLNANTEDELKSLVHGFNHMVDQVKALLEQVHKEHEEKIKVEVNSLELRLELLQAQINPHFIHNTLNAVKYLALLKGAEDIREIIHSFNLLLRASISEARDFVSINEELELVDSYINIQRYRYDNDFQVLYNLDDCLERTQIPKLILQPIVENSLFHGIIPKDRKGTIKISIFAVRDKILISVIDDGVGIESDKLESIFSENLLQNSNKGFNNIGLKNINTRLKLYYGDDYTLQIESSVGKGTCVWFYIPK
ncbi:sensor histidine kinase [Desulfosporosinus orientis]|uniref:sensor histidine kinase n=1 Tax=Desulfosporosinus orientis TaxID=1563 RepID=UPI0011D22D97|nr:sensor histidine kinase [Desulfosporosinus orientis]